MVKEKDLRKLQSKIEYVIRELEGVSKEIDEILYRGRKIYNPVTKKYYKVKERASEVKDVEKVKGLWGGEDRDKEVK